MPSPGPSRALLRQAVARLAPVLPLLTDLGERFTDAGHELALVGGPVRDAFLGRTPPDLDFTTSASPDETEAILMPGVRRRGTWVASSGPSARRRDGTETTSR